MTAAGLMACFMLLILYGKDKRCAARLPVSGQEKPAGLSEVRKKGR
ncbi:hypothetical protein HMPREF1548_05385 [Clostridium sp. KLE 1755]|nr:hypothetical protein HMPREF1548_05385 [Clostridium sp. KLE 1755]